ncbi:MAG: MerR family DNA-binding transcriptional regulator [Gemmataceae bacterium]|nr:MerR family DNA-binding transcriptional regulator [Gemmataceae bacterium]
MAVLKTSEVARQAGVEVETLRFYERKGLRRCRHGARRATATTRPRPWTACGSSSAPRS